jgi:putative pyruvate formate lyase activating enzyme
VETIEALEGEVDIYLPDFKYWDEVRAARHLGVHGYPQTARAAIKSMYSQVGALRLNNEGLAVRGLSLRYLVMPGQQEDARRILEWVATELGCDTYLNVMPQYRPEYRAAHFPELAVSVTVQEWFEVMCLARRIGFRNLHPYPILERAMQQSHGARPHVSVHGL